MSWAGRGAPKARRPAPSPWWRWRCGGRCGGCTRGYSKPGGMTHRVAEPGFQASSRIPAQGLMPGLALATLGAITFSGKAIIVKLAYRYGVDAVTLIMLRMLFALPLFAAMGWWASRGKAPLSPGDWLGVSGLGVTGYYLSSFLDFAGLQDISASLVLLLAWALYRRQFRGRQLVGLAVSYCGVILVFGHEARLEGAQAALGALLVFGSACTYAVYLVYSGQLVQRLGALRLVGLATTVACVCCLLQFAVLRPLGTAFDVAPQVLWLSVLNATLCTAIPVLMVMMAVERIGPALSAQAGMVGPISTILMSVLILGEPF